VAIAESNTATARVSDEPGRPVDPRPPV
jgi:hypothetical protein